LEELAKIFDGENAEVGHVDMHEIEKDIHAEPLVDGKGATKIHETAV